MRLFSNSISFVQRQEKLEMRTGSLKNTKICKKEARITQRGNVLNTFLCYYSWLRTFFSAWNMITYFINDSATFILICKQFSFVFQLHSQWSESRISQHFFMFTFSINTLKVAKHIYTGLSFRHTHLSISFSLIHAEPHFGFARE